MTTVAEEKYDTGTGPDDFIAPDEPPADDPPGVSAGQDTVPDADEEAPYGWTRDKQTGELRPKMRPGRPKTPESPEQLAGKPALDREPDRPPKRTRAKPAGALTGTVYPPMPEGGTIARGVNRLYRRAGKIVRAMDYDIGTAIIECTRKDDEDDITVGEAWENVCKTNPRIRAFILKIIEGGAWGELVMAHAPIFLAIAMKPAVLRLLPFRRLIESMAERDEESPDGDLAGLTPEDVERMGGLAEEAAAMAAQRFGRPVPPDVMADAMAAAERMMGGDVQVPAGLRRQQPKSTTRAQRRK